MHKYTATPKYVLLVAFLLMPATCSSVRAQETTPPAAPTVSVTTAPRSIQSVTAEGRAAIGTGGVLGARRAAQAQALRNAVEQALGVYVGARTLTQNYQMVRDQVLTRSDGYATLKEIVREEVGTQEVRVTVRADVSLRPLATQLKGLGLTRAWRVSVTGKGDRGSAGRHAKAAVSALEKSLTDAGFVVVSDTKDADLNVTVTPTFETIMAQNVPAGDLTLSLHSVRGDVSVQAVKAGTGEVVASLSSGDTAMHVDLATARAEATTQATASLAPKLVDALMVLPAALSQPVTLVVENLKSSAQVGRLEDALEATTGVQRVTRRGFQSGSATWELDVLSDAASQLPRNLEESPQLRPFRLAVSSETRSKIVAASRPIKPARSAGTRVSRGER